MAELPPTERLSCPMTAAIFTGQLRLPGAAHIDLGREQSAARSAA